MDQKLISIEKGWNEILEMLGLHHEEKSKSDVSSLIAKDGETHEKTRQQPKKN